MLFREMQSEIKWWKKGKSYCTELKIELACHFCV